MAVAFGLQIYFDFSSYSRMAIGSAKLCGIQLVDNFNYPYSATSPVDFWNRWHMSLSRWIRDYLFFPLLGKKATLGAMCRAALISMTLCGIWHGAGWPFLLWGAVSRRADRRLPHRSRIGSGRARRGCRRSRAGSAPLGTLAAMLVTFALVSLGWVFFRSATTAQALGLVERALMPWEYSYRALSGNVLSARRRADAGRLGGAAGARAGRSRWPSADEARPAVAAVVYWIAQGGLVGAMLVLCLIYLRGQTAFIYFQF